MNNDRQKILTDYISYLYTTGRTYDTVGKYIKHVTDFLEMTKEVNRRGYLNYKRENADVMVRHSLMCSAICDLLSYLNIGYGKREKKSMPLLYLFIERYKNSDLKEIFRFANGLEKDIEAVENSVASELSNGFVEGTNSKLKMVKRTMYGRCYKTLLAARLMYTKFE